MRYVIPPLLALLLLVLVGGWLRRTPPAETEAELYGPPSDYVLAPHGAVRPAAHVPKPPGPSVAPEQTDRALQLCQSADQLAADGRFAEARTLYQKAFKLDPGFVMALHGVASTYVGEKNYGGALAAFRRLDRLLSSGSDFQRRVRKQIRQLEEMLKETEQGR